MGDLGRWNTVVDGVYAAAMGERDWCAVVSDLETAFGAAGATVFDVDVSAGAVVDIVANRLAPAQSDYVDRMNAINPRMLRALGRRGPHVAVDYDGLPEAAICRHEFYDWLQRECGVKYFVGARMADDGPIMSFASIDFTAHHGPAADEEVELFRRLVPHIANAWRMAGRLKLLETISHAAVEAAGRASIGIIGLAADGKVTSASPEAQRILQAGDGLQAMGGELRADRSATDRGLQMALARALRTARGEDDSARTLIAVPRRSGRLDYVVEVAPCANRHERQPHDMPVVFVFVTDPVAGGVTQQALQELYGLSPREAELAVLLQRGEPITNAASAMGITLNTARVHLVGIRRKTGTASRAELAGLLGGIRPLASPVPR
jgi:DNA-binding CsgD family transcriptional regulator